MRCDIDEETLLNFFRALSDPNRLKIIGLLARQNYTGEQLAEILNLRASTVSHHLARLVDAGLVSARAESYYNIYQLNTHRLEAMAKQVLTEEALPDLASDVDANAYDKKIVADYSLPDGRLKTIPAQRKKLEAVLRYIARSFKPGVRYSEKEVNLLLSRFHSDTSSLRRELIGNKLLLRSRDGSEYWLAEEQSNE